MFTSGRLAFETNFAGGSGKKEQQVHALIIANGLKPDLATSVLVLHSCIFRCFRPVEFSGPRVRTRSRSEERRKQGNWKRIPYTTGWQQLDFRTSCHRHVTCSHNTQIIDLLFRYFLINSELRFCFRLTARNLNHFRMSYFNRFAQTWSSRPYLFHLCWYSKTLCIFFARGKVARHDSWPRNRLDEQRRKQVKIATKRETCNTVS